MKTNIERREFLGQAGTAALASGAVASGLALANRSLRAAESPSQKVVIGVMGMSRGRSLAEGFQRLPGVEVKYVCDVDTTRAAAGATAVAKVGAKPKAIGDFRRILDDKEIDALVCAAPNHWHAPATIIACAAGKNCYVEKPCSHNPREGELMVEAARKHGKAVQMGSQRRSGPGTIEAIKKLHEGVIGRVYQVRSWYNNARTSLGHGKKASVPSNLDYELWQGPAPRTAYLDNRVHYNWHWFWQWGNGELGNNGVHTLDLCRWGLDADFPIRVTSSGGRYRYDDDQQTPDTHTVCYEFEGKRSIVWESLSCNRHSGGFVNFYGEKGTLELESNGTYTIYDERDRKGTRTVGNGRGDSEHLVNFVTAIRNDRPLELNAEIAKGHKSTLLCHLGNIAQRTGRTLNCSPANGHILGDEKAMDYWSREYEKGWEPQV
jgi:predicted dehydrogenase